MAETLRASTVTTASGSLALTPSQVGRIVSAVFLLDVTAAATDVDDTLNVFLQHSVDGGSTYDDFVAWTEVLGNGGAKAEQAHWSRVALPESELRAAVDAALGDGVLQGPVGNDWRLKWTIVDPGAGTASFTFAVTMSSVLGGR